MNQVFRPVARFAVLIRVNLIGSFVSAQGRFLNEKMLIVGVSSHRVGSEVRSSLISNYGVYSYFSSFIISYCRVSRKLIFNFHFIAYCWVRGVDRIIICFYDGPFTG